MSSPTAVPDGPFVRIRADEPRRPIDFDELFRYRDLLLSLADRDIRIRYKQTALGAAWVVLQPLISALIFAFVFGVVAGLPSDGRPYFLFAFTGLLAWNTFAAIVTRVSNSLVSGSHMISKIYFPRLVLPFSAAISCLVDFGVSLGIMVGLMAIYRAWPGWSLLSLPIWLVLLVVMAVGLGLIAASTMVRYRDVGHIIPVVLQLGLFASPVAWSVAAVPQKYRFVTALNPLCGLLGAFRWSLLGDVAPSALELAYSAAFAAVALFVGLRVFQRQEREFADVI